MTSDARKPLAIWVSAVVFAIVVFGMSWWRWWTFQYGTFDVAFYIQALWLALRGEWNVSLLDVPLMGNHAEPIVFLLLPIFALLPHAMTLVGVQTLALASMPFTAWRIATRLGYSSRTACLMAAGTVLAPAAGFIGIHEFHPEAFSAPLLLLMIEARVAERVRRYWLWFLGALACKENIALLLVAYCGVHFVWEWRRGLAWLAKWYVWPGAVALAWLALYAKVLSPMLNGGKVDYLELYSHLGSSGGEIVGNFFTEPQRALRALGKALAGGDLVWGLLIPFAGLPLLRPKWLLIGAPVLLQHLLSWRSSEWSLHFHYTAPLLPLFWMGAIEALKSVRWPTQFAIAIAAACAVWQGARGPMREIGTELADAPDRYSNRMWKAESIRALAADHQASVMASQPYLSHLALRQELRSLHHLLKGLKTLSREGYETPPPADAVVIDFADETTFNVPSGYYHPTMRTVEGRIVPSSDQLLHDYLKQGEWAREACNELLLLRKSEGSGAAAKANANEPSPQITIVEAKFTPTADETIADLSLTFALPPNRKEFPWVVLTFSNESGAIPMILGMAAPGATEERFEQRWKIRIPEGATKPGVRVHAILYDHSAAAWNGERPPGKPPRIKQVIPLTKAGSKDENSPLE